jgi:hypothetical protein
MNMSCKPILFNTSMVQAIRAGRKTMTRRVINPQPGKCLNWVKSLEQNPAKCNSTHFYLTDINWGRGPEPTICCRNCQIPYRYGVEGKIDSDKHICPVYRPGDILWVRETWKVDASDHDNDSYTYKADPGLERYPNNLLHWRPSIFMPKAAARIFLRVTDVRAERLQNITPDDIGREGTPFGMTFAPYDGFSRLWDGINAKRKDGAYAWDRDPWVWVYAFERIDKPTDWPKGA